MSFIGGIAQGVGAVAGATIQANAANKATEAQEREANNVLGFNKQVYSDQQANLAPYLQAGQNGLSQLLSGVGNVAPNSLTTANFVNPNSPNGSANFSSTAGLVPNPAASQLQPNFNFTGQDLQNDPGYQFTLDQGIKANQRAASALGVSGGAAKSLAQYTTGLASTHFNDAYNRALSTQQVNLNTQNQNYNQALAGQQQQFGQDLSGYNANLAGYQTNVNNTNNAFNHLASIAGVGQSAADQANAAGQQAASNFANASSAAANAQSAGAIASGNAIAGGITGATNALSNYFNYNAVYGKH